MSRPTRRASPRWWPGWRRSSLGCPPPPIRSVLAPAAGGIGPARPGSRGRGWRARPRVAGVRGVVAGGTRYRLRRDFDTQRVRIARMTPSGWEELLTGEHNPAARRRLARYEEFLQGTFGLASRDLFMST